VSPESQINSSPLSLMEMLNFVQFLMMLLFSFPCN
jgi:hypothetical protein